MEEKKLKVALSLLGFFLVLIVGLAIYNFSNNTSRIEVNTLTKISPKIANNQNTKPEITKEEIITTSPVIGDAEIDNSINSVVNDVLAENDLEAEFEDVEIALSEEEIFTQINNLFNENEL